MKEELNNLKYLLNKREITYNVFNELIGNYYVANYEEFEDGYYLISVISKLHGLSSSESDIYTDYIRLIEE